MKPRRRVEVLTIDGCPNAQAARALVDCVVTRLGLEAEVASVRVDDLDAAKRLRLLGSPNDSGLRARRRAESGR